MARPVAKTFSRPDQVIDLDFVRQEILELGDLTIARITYQPGWRWSTHIQPIVGGTRCQTRHLGVLLVGHMGVELADGSVRELTPGTVFDIPPGHDGYVIGDDPSTVIEWAGVREWALPIRGERVLATLLLTDIVGSTEHAERLGDHAWRELLAAHNETIRDELGHSRAREVATTGDGVLALFDGPARAIEAALAIRRRVRGAGLELRQAVHVGEVELVGDDVRGLAVNETARMLAAAAPGEIVASGLTRSLASGTELAFESRGEHSLRGISGPRELFAVEAATRG